MFYSHDILQKRGGKFGIVWLVATISPQLTRRQYLSVRINKTCEDIMDSIFHREPCAKHRLSLYLSAQLMYGLVKVYSKQNKYLYDDVTRLMSKLHSSSLLDQSKDIDLKYEPTKPNLPDLVCRVDPLSADFDFTFGIWTDFSAEDIALLEQEMFAPLSPWLKLSPTELSPTIQTYEEMTAEALKAPNTVSSPEDIRLKEDLSSITDLIQIPGEKELPTFDGREIEVIPESELVEVPITLADLLPRKPRSRSTSSVSDIIPLTEETFPLPPIPGTPTAEKKVTEESEARQPSTPQRHPVTPGVTPIQPEEPRSKRRRVRLSLPMELEPVPPGSSARRKRRLQFADTVTQMTKRQLKNNIVNGKATCMPLLLPTGRPSSAEELFARPGQKCLTNPLLLKLWTRNAVTKSNGMTEEEENDPSWTTSELLRVERELAEVAAEKADLDQRTPAKVTVQSSDSDKSPQTRRSRRLARQPIEEEEQLRKDQSVEESLEVARGDSMLSLEGSRLKDISIEIEKSRQSLDDSKSRSRRGSDQIFPGEEIPISLVPEHDSMYMAIPATVQEEGVPASVLPSSDENIQSPSAESNSQQMMRHIGKETEAKTWTKFHSICRTKNTYRSYAAKMFSGLLDMCAQQTATVTQKEPYGDIHIRRGPNW